MKTGKRFKKKVVAKRRNNKEEEDILRLNIKNQIAKLKSFLKLNKGNRIFDF